MDDEIVNDLFEKFPEFKFDDALRNLDEDWMKSKAGKEKWRAFIMPVSPEPTGSFSLHLGALATSESVRGANDSMRKQSTITTLVHLSGKMRRSCMLRIIPFWSLGSSFLLSR